MNEETRKRLLALNREKRKILAEAGLCANCHKEKSAEGKRWCETCLARHRIIMKKMKLARKEKGLCTKCGQPKDDDGFKMCPACRERQREYYAQIKSDLAELSRMKREMKNAGQ